MSEKKKRNGKVFRNLLLLPEIDDMAEDLAHERRCKGGVSALFSELVSEELARMNQKKSAPKNSLNSIPRVLPATLSGEEPLPKRIRKKFAG